MAKPDGDALLFRWHTGRAVLMAKKNRDIHEARAIAHTLLRAFPDGAPKCWGESAQAVVANALRLAELAAELLPLLDDAVAD